MRWMRARAWPHCRASRPRVGQGGLGDDAAAERLAGDALHEEAFAHRLRRLQHPGHGRRGHAGRGHQAQQHGLRGQRGVALGTLCRAGRRAPQDQRQRAAIVQPQVEGPGLLAGATRQAPQVGDVAPAGVQLRGQRDQLLLQLLLRTQLSHVLNSEAGSAAIALGTLAPRSSSFFAVTKAAASLIASTACNCSPR